MKNTDMSKLLSWVSKQWIRIYSQQPREIAILNLIKISQKCNYSEPELSIQLSGKNMFIKKQISEIIENEEVLCAFKKSDMRTIMDAHTQWLVKPKLKLKSIIYNDEIEIVYEGGEGASSLQSLHKITDDKKEVARFSSVDSFRLGFLKGNREL